MLLVFPPFGCATPAVYRAFDALPLARADHTPGFDERAGMVHALARECRAESLFNDLTPAASLVQPALTPLMRELRTLAPNVHMTGSGSTLMVFGPSLTQGVSAAMLERLGCAGCQVSLQG